MNEETKKCAIAYVRVSSESEDEIEASLEYQLNSINKFCNVQGYELYWYFVDFGRPEEPSSRPGFYNGVLECCGDSKIKVDCLVVAEPKRLAKAAKRMLFLLDLFESLDVKVEYADKKMAEETMFPLFHVGVDAENPEEEAHRRYMEEKKGHKNGNQKA